MILNYEVDDCDAAKATGKAAGLPVPMRGRRDDRSGFTYLDMADAAGMVLEIRQSAGPQVG